MTGAGQSLSGNSIWAAWAHLWSPQEDLDKIDPEQQLDRDSLEGPHKGYLSIIEEHAEQLLSGGGNRISLDEKTLRELMLAIGDAEQSASRFKVLRRFLEVIDAGNRNGCFLIKIPYLPAPLPPAPKSPFLHERYQEMLRLRPLIDAFLASLATCKEPLDEEQWWGRTFFSAMMFGGLLRVQGLLAMSDALQESDPALRWLDLRIKQNQQTDKVVTYRWLPDPLTRLLLAQRRLLGIPAMSGKGRDTTRVMRLLRRYANKAEFKMDPFNNWTALRGAIETRLHLYLPPYLVHYLLGDIASTSLPEEAWRRLVQPPQAVVSDALESLRPSQQELPETAVEPEWENDSKKDQTEDTEEEWPVQLRALVSVIRKGDDNISERVSDWLTESEASLLPSIRCLGEWITEYLLKSGHSRRPLRSRTIYSMLNAIGARLVGQLGNTDPKALEDVDEFVELYQTALEDTSSSSARRRVAHALRSFHQYLHTHHGAPSLKGSGLFTVRGGIRGGVVDANLIGTDTFFLAMQWLNNTASREYGTAVADALCRVMGLGYFAGLRRSEAIGLKIDDIAGTRDVFLLVRPNAFRRLKTCNAQRLLPLSDLMPKEELRRLREWQSRRQEEKKIHSDSGDALFYIPSLGRRLRDNDPALEMVTEALQRATHDLSVRFHHLRHSFANWQLLKFWLAEQTNDSEALPSWLRTTQHDLNRIAIAVTERQRLLGKSVTNRRSLMQISRLLGHSSPDITLTHYVHLLDLIAGRMMRRLAPEIRTKALVTISGYSESHIRRLRAEGRKKAPPEVAEAEALENIVTGLLADGRRKRSPGEVKPRVDVLKPSSFAPPTTPLGRLIELAKAVEAAARGADIAGICARHTGISESVLKAVVEQYRKKDASLLRRTGKSPEGSASTIDLPQGPKQERIATKAAETLERLMSKGDDSGQQRQTIRKRLREISQQFVSNWKRGTPLTVEFDSLPAAKNWMWLLEQLQLTAGVLVRHRPGHGKTVRPLPDQRDHWEKRLGRTLDSTPLPADAKESSSARGGVEIRVDPKCVPNEVTDGKDPKVLYGLRFVLVMRWLESASRKKQGFATK